MNVTCRIALPTPTLHPHALVLTTNPYGPTTGWTCNNCSVSYAAATPSNHCYTCHFDLCAMCVTNLNNIPCVPPPAQNPFHPHPLVLTKPYGGLGWTCNKCGVMHNGGDLANHCELCRFDLCSECIHWNSTGANVPTIA